MSKKTRGKKKEEKLAYIQIPLVFDGGFFQFFFQMHGLDLVPAHEARVGGRDDEPVGWLRPENQ